MKKRNEAKSISMKYNGVMKSKQCKENRNKETNINMKM